MRNWPYNFVNVSVLLLALSNKIVYTFFHYFCLKFEHMSVDKKLQKLIAMATVHCSSHFQPNERKSMDDGSVTLESNKLSLLPINASTLVTTEAKVNEYTHGVSSKLDIFRRAVRHQTLINSAFSTDALVLTPSIIPDTITTIIPAIVAMNEQLKNKVPLLKMTVEVRKGV